MPPQKNRSAEVLADPDPGENMDTRKRVLRSRPSLTQSSEASQKPKASKRNSANPQARTASWDTS
ncbi:hypothetical protein HBI56_019370 [Parastagonospora nodorum]|nr:hypothetical protein HBH53_003420 [Parastagonospora nodorum]KAH3982196.1 hypothetical protein HBH52_076310 [Parastagonospora nodorum]KAH4198870.1 hypothetical protein HBH42_049830 [Parastagonospora nodorum]KAH4304281.1 hypothetical protein HBI01_079100 [Parastagonospora nodorum]KAH4318006.1 hypothetical protein HBI02_021690 [Parastagonospora nodorum]